MSDNRTYSYYHAVTGKLAPTVSSMPFNVDPATFAPPDHLAIEGRFDSLSQRVDVATGNVVDYQPPAPSDDFEWDGATKRWLLNADAVVAIEQHEAAKVVVETTRQDVLMLLINAVLDGDKASIDALRSARDALQSSEATVAATSEIAALRTQG